MYIIKKIYLRFFQAIKRILFILQLSLVLRLLLKFLDANASAPVVGFIYRYTDFLIKPFESIFTDIPWQGKLIETSTISAIFGYWILVFVFFRLINLFARH